MARLSKRDVEQLLDDYDADPLGALNRALAAVGAESTLIASVQTMSEPERDSLVRDLVEWRGLTAP